HLPKLRLKFSSIRGTLHFKSLCNKAIHNWNISRINFTFTEDQLEDFFTKNRKTILKDIRSLNNIFNPLDNYEINIIFQMHKKIESFKEKFESKKLVTVN
ncbi:hypothetical protein, partial [Acinetobacter schindleri]|uniref:hypothetical protein n=1 Tax=Acinetobacter schindleri TaxID=108981 RepID=UPI0021CDDBB6